MGSEHQIEHALEVSGLCWRDSRSRNTRSCISSGLQDLKGSAHQIEHACEVSGWGCRISRVGNTRSTVPTGYKDGAAGSHRQGTSDCTCLRGTRVGMDDLTGKKHQIEHAYMVSGRGCRISRVGNYRSCMPTMYQEWTSGSHGFETRGIRTGLQDLTGSEHKIVDRIRTGLQDLTDKEHQIVQQIHHAYKV